MNQAADVAPAVCYVAGKYQLAAPGPLGEKEALYSVCNSVDTNFELPPEYSKTFPFTVGIASEVET